MTYQFDLAHTLRALREAAKSSDGGKVKVRAKAVNSLLQQETVGVTPNPSEANSAYWRQKEQK